MIRIARNNLNPNTGTLLQAGQGLVAQARQELAKAAAAEHRAQPGGAAGGGVGG